jgi:hypothetical protein
MKVLSVVMVALGPEPAAWAMARTEGKPAVMAAAAVMRRRLRRESIQQFHQLGETPVERISGRDASPYSAMFSMARRLGLCRKSQSVRSYSLAVTIGLD